MNLRLLVNLEGVYDSQPSGLIPVAVCNRHPNCKHPLHDTSVGGGSAGQHFPAHHCMQRRNIQQRSQIPSALHIPASF